MAIVDTTLDTENKGGNYKYDVFMQDTQEGLFGADIEPDSVLEMNYTGESEATSEPIEKGNFASFYKTNSPDTISIVFSFNSDDARQNAALDKIEERKKGYELISILTPTHLYEDMTILTYSYSRTNSDGMTLLVLQVDFQKVKQVAINTGVAQYKNVTSASKKNTGKKQATDAKTEAKVRRSTLEDVKKGVKQGAANFYNTYFGNN